jgi:hypothetical protein
MCIKCAKAHLRASVISKNFPGLYPDPIKKGGTPGEKGGKRRGKGKRGGEGKGGD